MIGNCPTCDAQVNLKPNVEVSEVVACPECQTKLEIKSIEKLKGTVELKEAPKVEEDWGE